MASQNSTERRRASLDSYLKDVVRDLLARGVIRGHGGQSAEEIIRGEAKTVYEEVLSDLKAAGLGILGSVIGGAVEGFFRSMTSRR